ncbi:MAG: helix-turn-helix transcriptional regulator [Taibaiella sp.]|nr:helix-turn-helix transcriptional regulator [Taibaiella sp.]
MTTNEVIEVNNSCPAEALLKMLSGKWKPQIFLRSQQGPMRFSELLRDLKGSNKQSVSVALRELEESGLLSKATITQKPLHIEYSLTEKGKAMIPIFHTLELLTD